MLFSRKFGFVLAIASSFALAACESGDDPTSPTQQTTPPVTGHDTSKSGVPLPAPPKPTCSNDPKTGEVCVGTGDWTTTGSVDIPASLTGSISSMTFLGDTTMWVNLGQSVVRISRTKNTSTGAVSYTVSNSTIGLSATDRPITFCNGKLYAVKGLDLIDEINISTGTVIRTLNQSEQMTKVSITSLSCSPDGKYLLVGDANRTVNLYVFATDAIGKAFTDTSAASGSAALSAWSSTGNLYMFAGTIGKNTIPRLDGKPADHVYPVIFVTPSTNSNSAATVYYPILSARKPVVALAFDKWPVAIAQDSTVRVYDPSTVANGQYKEKCVKLSNGAPSAVATRGDFFAEGDSTGNFAVWKVGTPTCDLQYRSQSPVTNGPVTAMRFTTDGSLEISGGRRIVTFRAPQ